MYKASFMPFCRDNYETEDERMKAVADFVALALKNHQKMAIWDDGLTIVVEYDYAEPELGHALVWLDENEYVDIG